MMVLAERTEGDLQVFEDAVGLLLVGEGFFLGPRDGVQPGIEHRAQAGGLLLVDQVLGPGRVQQHLHELLGLADVKERAVLLGVAHRQHAGLFVPDRVAERARGHLDHRVALLEAGGNHSTGKVVDVLDGLRIARAGAAGFAGFFGLDLGGGLFGHGCSVDKWSNGQSAKWPNVGGFGNWPSVSGGAGVASSAARWRLAIDFHREHQAPRRQTRRTDRRLDDFRAGPGRA
jgi:hypothetical protein